MGSHASWSPLSRSKLVKVLFPLVSSMQFMQTRSSTCEEICVNLFAGARHVKNMLKARMDLDLWSNLLR